MKTAFQRKKAWLAIALTVLYLLLILISGLLFPEANAIMPENRFQSPSLEHWFGTDNFGRDVFARTMIGFRYTFVLAFISQIGSFSLGVILGIILGYYGGIADEIFYHLSNLILSFPIIILGVLVAGLTNADITYLLMVMIAYGTVANSKIIRSEIKIIKNADYIRSLKVLGVGDFHIIKDHLVKKCLRMLFPNFALLIGHVIISISSFSFLGFGVQPPQPEIGNMLNESLRFINHSPWLMIFPGLFQFGTVLLILNLSNQLKALFLDNKRA